MNNVVSYPYDLVDAYHISELITGDRILTLISILQC